jgi:hypothetical protein
MNMIDYNVSRLTERAVISRADLRLDAMWIYVPAAITWNRLEGRPRSNDLTRPLRTEIRDPLWFLARQWQLGEFDAQDAGTPIHARMSTQVAEPRSITYRNGVTKNYDRRVPLEVTVERQPVQPDLMMAIHLGRRWLKRLAAGAAPAALVDSFRTAYGFAVPTKAVNTAESLRSRRERPDAAAGVLATDLESLELATQSRELTLRRSIAGRSLDGGRLLVDIVEAARDGVTASARFAERGVTIGAPRMGDINAAAADLLAFWKATFSQPETGEDGWAPPHLEYDVRLAVPEGDKATALIADQYPGGHMDWYSFDSGPGVVAAGGPALPPPKAKTFLPTAIQFRGAPKERWWEFEEAEVGFGITSAAKTDLVKMLLAEFGLVFSNDWFIVPFAAEVGSLIDNRGIVVTDNFGFRTFVEPTARQQNRRGLVGTWGMWTLTRRGVPGAVDERLFLAPAVMKSLETRPLDEVLFLRDEMANLVWGVESVIPNPLGGGRDGRAAAKMLREAMIAAAPPPDFEDLGPEVLLRYSLMGTVPENWIPFVSVTLANEIKSTAFLQGAMPRVPPLDPAVEGGVPVLQHNVVLPRGSLLMRDPVASPNVIFEEEVLREGATIRRTNQRTRSVDGRTWTWSARKKTAGRGEGSSGLAFDQALLKKPQEQQG